MLGPDRWPGKWGIMAEGSNLGLLQRPRQRTLLPHQGRHWEAKRSVHRKHI